VPDWTSVEDIIDDALAATQHLADANGVDLQPPKFTALPNLYCDQRKIVAALQNLIQNAVMAMPDGGTLTITANFILQAPHPCVAIKVIDTGDGIAEDILEEVLEPFFTTRVKGTGLGLAIVKGIIDAHHGDISIHSKVGVGTEVEIILPTAPPETSEQSNKPERSIPGENNGPLIDR